MIGSSSSRTAFHRFSLFAVGYSLLVILWGAYVRATGSGAGCGDHWPLCNGQVIPTAVKTATWIEFLHRASSGVSLILVVILFFWSRKLSERHSLIRRTARFSLIAIVLEALLGAGLVLLKLVEFDQSVARAVSIALHLVNTLFLLACLVSLAHLSRETVHFESPPRRFLPRDPGFWFCLGVFVLLGMSGAVTALGDTLFPAKTLAEGLANDFRHDAHFLVRLRVIHPVLALGWIASVFHWSRKLEVRELSGIRGLLLGGVVVQLLIGVMNWVLMAPNSLQLLHLLVADLVFIAFFIAGVRHEARESGF